MLSDDLRKAWREGSWDVQEVKGAYYSDNMIQARREERICQLEYEPHVRVMTAWDLGGDTMCVWNIQAIARQFRWIKFMHGEGGGIAGYIKRMIDLYGDQSENGNLGTMFFPHDITTRDPTYNRTRISLVEDMGITDYVIVPKQDPADRRNAMKMIFPRCYFDDTKGDNEYGVQAMQQYRREWDEVKQIFKPKHLDNWAAHPADAAGTFAQGYEEKVQSKKPPKTTYSRSRLG